ncbi:FGGY-family carbohydrate kinase [Paenibacillus puerhi]|uniref:FGGY-family carbohydrate kinase n=1 Tax=Paenibacillus puerhi TaxID=2692622 RepID=UPI001358C8C3|nr:FGGY family carbohydrate kinase [Paenibacillus puerhi]
MKKKESLYIGIDISSTHIKVAAYDNYGNLKEVASTPTPVHMTKSGGTYHLADELREKTFNTIQACMERVQGHKIKAIGISSVAESGVLLDEDGESLGPIMAWYDQRPNIYLNHVREQVPTLDFYRKTGLFPETTKSLLKFLWMKDNMPDVWKKSKSWLHIAEYIVFCLTGEMKSEYSLASRSMVFNITKRQWDDDLLLEFDIKKELLQETVQAGTVHGYVLKAASEYTKIPEGTPVTIAGHHPVVGAFGIGAMLDGDVTDVSDMMETLIITMPFQNMDNFQDAQVFTVGCHVVPGHHYALLDVGTTGGIVEWFLTITGWDYPKLLTVLAKANGVNKNLGFYPTSLGDSPADNHVQTAWFGGQLTNSYPDQMASSIIQGLSCWFRNKIEQLHQLNIPIKRLMVAGEATKNPYWMQVKADLLNRPLHICRKWEGSSRGAAILAAKSIDEMDEFSIPPSLTVMPNAAKSSEMEDFYVNSYLKNIEMVKKMLTP